MGRKLPEGIYRRGPRYYVRCRIRGKLIRRTAGTTLAEARRVLNELRSERTSSSPPPSIIRFEALAERYLTRVRLYGKHRSFTTASQAVGVLGRFFGGREVEELASWDLDDYLSSRLSKVGRETVNRELRYLKAILRQASTPARISKVD